MMINSTVRKQPFHGKGTQISDPLLVLGQLVFVHVIQGPMSGNCSPILFCAIWVLCCLLDCHLLQLLDTRLGFRVVVVRWASSLRADCRTLISTPFASVAVFCVSMVSTLL